jgi:hypothetical protein
MVCTGPTLKGGDYMAGVHRGLGTLRSGLESAFHCLLLWSDNYGAYILKISHLLDSCL